jgi:hypothetical protein
VTLGAQSSRHVTQSASAKTGVFESCFFTFKLRFAKVGVSAKKITKKRGTFFHFIFGVQLENFTFRKHDFLKKLVVRSQMRLYKKSSFVSVSFRGQWLTTSHKT